MIERSSCSRSQGHSRRSRRVSSSRAAIAAATLDLASLVIGLRPATCSPAGPAPQLPDGAGVAVPLPGATAPGVGVGVGFGAFLQSWVANSSRHSVFSFHFLRKSLTNASSAFCWFCDASTCLIVVLACSSVCCDAFVTLSTRNTYHPNCVLTGPDSLPFLALKIASSNAFSCWPFATAGSLPPCALDASSIEYCFATDLNDSPDSSAALACLALASVLVSTMLRSRRSGCANCALFLL